MKIIITLPALKGPFQTRLRNRKSAEYRAALNILTLFQAARSLASVLWQHFKSQIQNLYLPIVE
jgi:hypothetical protein